MKALRSIRRAGSLSLALLLAACATAGKKPEQVIKGPKVEDGVVQSETLPVPPPGAEIYGPAAPSEAEIAAQPAATQPPPAPPPAPPEPRAPKLCVVLGPGMAKAIAHAAVLEVLAKAKLPIGCVVGTEMGAVVGALYSVSGGSANTLQWELFKINKGVYFQFPVFSLKETRSSGKRMNSFLRELFHGKRIQDLPIPFAAVATDAESGATVPLESGDIADALSASLALAPVFEPWTLGDGRSLVSGALSSPAPIDLAQKLGGTTVILVSVIEDVGSGAADRLQKAFVPVRNLLRMQKREASYVLQVKLPKIPYDDFSRQGEILSAGTEAAEEALPKIQEIWAKNQAEAEHK